MYGSAEPGGNGDGIRDMQCGGACHGDASLNGTSTAQLLLIADSEMYEGIPASLTLTASGLQTGYSGIVGLFLLTDTTGHSDTPQDAGWEVLSDVNGGSNNYVEITLEPGQTDVTLSWVVRPSAVGSTPFYAAIHHGGSSTPYFGITAEPLVVTVEEVPENLPRLHPDFKPPTSRLIGETTTLEITTLQADQFTIEWRYEDGPINVQILNSTETNVWFTEFPAALQPSTLQWRAVLDGEGPIQTTPWFTLLSEEPSWEVDQIAVYMQAFALLTFVAGLVLVLQSRFTRREETKAYDQTMAVLSLSPSDEHDSILESTGPPIPKEGLPDGWNEDQWSWYGHDYLAGKYGGEKT